MTNCQKVICYEKKWSSYTYIWRADAWCFSLNENILKKCLLPVSFFLSQLLDILSRSLQVSQTLYRIYE
jgi:hypothetical protein